VFLGRFIFDYSPLLSHYINTILNYLLAIGMITAWFAILFRFLPDARPAWGIVLRGAFLTGVLFTIGKVVLRWALSYSNINSLYGASASIVLLMLFVFYSALILYFGAAFIKIWSVYKSQPIEPLRYASHYQLITDEADVSGNEE